MSSRPAFVEPQLPTLVDQPPTGDGWIHEIKHDGYRTMLVLAGRDRKAFTRNGHLPSLASAYAPQRSDVVLWKLTPFSGRNDLPCVAGQTAPKVFAIGVQFDEGQIAARARAKRSLMAGP